MKIRLGSGLLFLNLLAVALAAVIFFIPSNGARAALGLPFVLFTPGYALITALFPRRKALDAIERIALSVGLSFAVVALLGLALNYTAWGIRLWPSLIVSGGFVLISSAVAEFRIRRLPREERFSVDIDFSKVNLGETPLSRALSVVLILAVLGTIGTLVYTIAFPKVGEKFTQFYILGKGGQAANYPVNFTLSKGVVTSVDYGGGLITYEGIGEITVGIINNEQVTTTYSVQVMIDGTPVKILVNGASVDEIGPVTLQNDEKSEQLIGFAPLHTGANQRVDFVLLVGGTPYFTDPPHIWINVSASP
jgi:uncharacterized membrane protein